MFVVVTDSFGVCYCFPCLLITVLDLVDVHYFIWSLLVWSLCYRLLLGMFASVLVCTLGVRWLWVGLCVTLVFWI